LASRGKSGLCADLPRHTHTSGSCRYGLDLGELSQDRRCAVAASIEDNENMHRDIATAGPLERLPRQTKC
jgi:hypothetical protein